MSDAGGGVRPGAKAAFAEALVLHRQGRLEPALAAYADAIRFDPGYAAAFRNRAVALAALGRLDAAIADLDLAIGIDPTDAGQYYSKGYLLHGLRRYYDAVLAFEQALERAPDNAAAYCNRCLSLLELDDPQAALESFDDAIRREPDLARAQIGRGMALARLDRLEPALASFDQAIILDPDLADAHRNRGLALAELSRLPEAIAAYDRAIAADPNLLKAYSNKTALLRLMGDFAAANALDARWSSRVERAAPKKRLSHAVVSGEAGGPKTILLHAKGAVGLGDTIQFCRYATVLGGLGHRVLLAPQPALAALLRTMPAPAAGSVELVRPGDDSVIPSCDYDCNFLGLPAVFRTTLDTIPTGVPYLAAAPDRLDRWARRIGKGGLRIGICWQGGASRSNPGRGFPLAQFAELSKIPGVRLISLQKRAEGARRAGAPEVSWIEDLGDDFDAGPEAFLDSAAVMRLCDLVITCDTAVAHLAGALAVPTWVVLRPVPEWRWQLHRSDSPWYPTMRLFRQAERGDWSTPFALLEQELRALLARR